MLTQRKWKRRTIRVVSAAAVSAIFAVTGLSAGRASDDEAMVSVVPRAAPPGRHASPGSNIRADVKVVLVPLSVSDPLDRPVTDLSPKSFRLFEDDVEQSIVSFSKEDGPVSVGFIFDASSSMKKNMRTSVVAIQQFLKDAMPGDEFFLVRFSNKPTLVTGFTRDPDEILSGLSFVQPLGWTALNDAICLGVHQMKAAKNSRRALFVLTDGGDNNSRYTEAEVKNLVLESDVRIYAIGLFERPRFLEKLAALSGGSVYWARHLKDLPDAVDQLSREFRNQYVLGYSPRNQQNDGKYRKVRIELVQSLRRAAFHLIWRRGYIAPD